MPKLLSVLAAVCLIAACSPQETEQDKTAENISPAAPQVPLDEEIYSFDLNTLTPGCSGDSQIICAINMSVKCTINPEFSECAEHKDEMPDFVFMQDESLQRPTSQSYKITKIKPLKDNLVEVYTQSTCNGNWFGLCNGNIIYVMNLKDGKWIVNELYAIEA